VHSTLRRNSLAILIFLLLALPLMAQMPQPFSADFNSTRPDGKTMTGKVYFSSPKIRMEMKGDGQQRGPFGGDTVMIIDGSTQTNDMLMPQMQMYMEFHGNNDRMNAGARNLQRLLTMNASCPEGYTCKKLGTEVVNGRPCDKFENTDKSGKTSTVWVDQKLHFPIRVHESDGTQVDYTNIKEGPQDPALFKVPAGYRPFDPSALGGPRRPQ
jgi:outer membrane lipoprotein-sorting protein